MVPVVVILVVASVLVGCTSGEADQVIGCGRVEPPATAVGELTAAELGDPVWEVRSDEATFSSPTTADLNGDGVLDVVQGFGQDTFGARSSSVAAFDGVSGEVLWRSSGHEDLIGSATFAPLGGDATPDVIIGGRRGALHAIDGADGSVLWSFDAQQGRWFNFYTNQTVGDVDGDGTPDLVAANGGLVFDEPSEQAPGATGPRNVGYVFVISGADGSVIASSPVPDRAESYMSALVLGSDSSEVLIGTGGETLPGALWRVPLASVLDETMDGAERVVGGGPKGIIATPSLAHLTGDCVVDVVVQAFDGTITAVDGATDSSLWQVSNRGYETYSSPTIGYFVGDDDVPDVFTAVALGVWPDYTESDYLLIDGATGEVAWRETLGTFGPSGFVAADLNGDGRDEVVFGANDEMANTQRIHLLDTARGGLHTLLTLDQTTFAAPWLGDLDDDGQLDLITTESAYQSGGPARIRRYSLGHETPATISWGGYLGTKTDGSLDR